MAKKAASKKAAPKKEAPKKEAAKKEAPVSWKAQKEEAVSKQLNSRLGR